MNKQAGKILVQEIAPRIRTAVKALPQVGADDHAELAQDTTVMAIKILASAQRRRKRVSPGNVAWYSVRHAKEGRRSGGYSSTDVLAPGTQLCGRSRLCSLDEVVVTGDETENGEPLALHDLIAAPADDPSVRAGRNADWRALVSRLDDNARAVLESVAQGTPLQRLATAQGVSGSSLQLRKKKLAQAIREFMGADLLKQVQQPPRWKDGLHANWQRALCRLERAAG